MRRSLDSIWPPTVSAHASACSVRERSSVSVAGRLSSTSRSRLIRAKSSGSGIWAAARSFQMRSLPADRVLALEALESVHQRARCRLPALPEAAQVGFVSGIRPADALEGEPGGALLLSGFAHR